MRFILINTEQRLVEYKDEIISMSNDLRDSQIQYYPQTKLQLPIDKTDGTDDDFIKWFKENVLENDPKNQYIDYYFLLEENDEIIGYVYFWYQPKELHLHINNLYMKPEYRNKGYGKLTIDTIRKYAKDNGIRAKMLSIYTYINSPAYRLYERYGFRPYAADMFMKN